MLFRLAGATAVPLSTVAGCGGPEECWAAEGVRALRPAVLGSGAGAGVGEAAGVSAASKTDLAARLPCPLAARGPGA